MTVPPDFKDASITLSYKDGTTRTCKGIATKVHTEEEGVGIPGCKPYLTVTMIVDSIEIIPSEESSCPI